MRRAELDRTVRDWRSPLAAPRLGVYRNNVGGALIGALRVRYPVTERLMGGQAFMEAAADFAQGQRPSSAVLIFYGGGFPDTLADAAMRDVARLESLWWEAYHSVEAVPLAPSALDGLTPEAWGALRFTLHPSVGLMPSRHGAADVWQAARENRGLSVSGAPQFILVARPEASVDVHVLPEAAYDFLTRIRAGSSLADAVEETSDAHPAFDATAAIQGLFSLRLVTGFET